jgi:hypothetical protein
LSSSHYSRLKPSAKWTGGELEVNIVIPKIYINNFLEPLRTSKPKRDETARGNLWSLFSFFYILNSYAIYFWMPWTSQAGESFHSDTAEGKEEKIDFERYSDSYSKQKRRAEKLSSPRKWNEWKVEQKTNL